VTPAVIVLDMLVDFVTGALANPRAPAIVPRVAELADGARERGWPVVFANDAHLPGDVEERVWGPHAMAGTPGAAVIPELAPREGDLVLPKRFYSAFHETGLDPLLRQNGVDTVILTGVLTDICVRHTAADAFFHGYAIVVPADAVEALTQQAHDEALDYLVMAYKADVTPVAELLGAVPVR
jgi:nicotinamidase-related amidase